MAMDAMTSRCLAGSARLLIALHAGGAATAAGALPDQLFQIEASCAEEAVAPPLPAAARTPGSVTVATGRRVDAGPSVTVRAGSAAPAAVQGSVVVANGATARLVLQGAGDAWAVTQLAATAPQPGASIAGRPASAAGLRAGVLLAPAAAATQAFNVTPRWPGIERPVQLQITLQRSPGLGVAEAASVLPVSLGAWTMFAQAQLPDGARQLCKVRISPHRG